MSAAPAGEPGTGPGRDRWYEKNQGSPLERFPVLGDALAAAAKAWTDSFTALSASPGELAFKGLRATTVAGLSRADGNPILASFRVPAWECMAALALDRVLVLTFVEALFGGEGEDLPDPARALSAVEMRMIDVIGGQAATALTGGFREFHPTRVEFDRTRPIGDARFLGKPPTPMLAAVFELRAIGRTAPLEVVLPLSAVEQNAAVWAGGAPSTAPLFDDTLWMLQLRAEVVRATMALQASIPLGPVSLGAIAGWRVGQVLDLPPASSTNVMLSCENEPLFRCDLGQSTGRYTVRIEESASGGDPPPRKDD